MRSRQSLRRSIVRGGGGGRRGTLTNTNDGGMFALDVLLIQVIAHEFP